MFKFPKKKIENTKSYAEEYLNTLSKVSKRIDYDLINKLSNLLRELYLSKKIFLSAVMEVLHQYQIILFVII